jgi:hypothetical protein
MSQSFSISAELAQALVDYLRKRPFDEVYQLVPALLELKPVPPQPVLTDLQKLLIR